MTKKLKQAPSQIKLLIVIGFTLFIQACAPTSVLLQDGRMKVETKKLKFRGDESLAVSYLAKELVSSEKQQITAKHFSKSEKVKVWSASDNAMSAKMMGDVLTGSMGSAEGEIFGSLVFVASLLGPDGSRDWVDKVFLPEKVDGQSIETEEEARNWLYKTVESNVHKAAEKNGWASKCIQNCGANNAIYELTLNSFPEKSLYNPEKIYVLAYIRGPLQKAKKDLLRDAAVGMPIAWEAGKDAVFLIRVISEPERDKNGNMVLKKVESEKSYLNGVDWVTSGKFVAISRVGQLLLKSLYDSPYMLKGYNLANIRRVFYNGKIYDWTPYKAHDGFVREEVLYEP